MSVDNEQLIADGDTSTRSQNLVFRQPNAGAVALRSASEVLPSTLALPTNAEWPVWKPPTFGWLARAYAVSAGLVGFYYKVLTDENHPIRALVVALLLPLLALAFDHAVTCLTTAHRRFAQYGPLRDSLSTTQTDLVQMKQQLSSTESLVRELLVASRRIEIARVQRINGRVILTLRPRRSMKLEKGNRVQIVDFTDGAVMGTCQIIELKPLCLATPVGNLNPVWSGYIHQAGAESSAPGNSAALLIEKELIEDEQS